MRSTLHMVCAVIVPVDGGSDESALEIYSYLRSPYRDLNMYDQSTQVRVCSFL